MPPLMLIYLCTRIITGIASMVFNLFTLICVITKRYLRSSANLLIASLALGDFLHGILFAIVLPIRYFGGLSIQVLPAACLASVCIETICTVCQFLIFTMLAFERRNSLLFQLNRGEKYSKMVLMAIVILMWTTSVLYNIMMTIFLAEAPEGATCKIVFNYPAFHWYILASLYLSATILILANYGHIAIIAFKSRNQVNQMQSAAQQSTRRKDMSITKMIALLVGVFFILYLPCVVIGISIRPTSPHWYQTLLTISILIYDINFWINPFIYAWRDKGFKKAFREVIAACHQKLCCWLPQVGGPGTITTGGPMQVAVLQVMPAVNNTSV